LRPHVLPPVEIARVPALQRLQHAAVLGEVDVVRDFLPVVDIDEVDHRTLHPLSCPGPDAARSVHRRSGTIPSPLSTTVPVLPRGTSCRDAPGTNVKPSWYRTPPSGRCRIA